MRRGKGEAKGRQSWARNGTVVSRVSKMRMNNSNVESVRCFCKGGKRRIRDRSLAKNDAQPPKDIGIVAVFQANYALCSSQHEVRQASGLFYSGVCIFVLAHMPSWSAKHLLEFVDLACAQYTKWGVQRNTRDGDTSRPTGQETRPATVDIRTEYMLPTQYNRQLVMDKTTTYVSKYIGRLRTYYAASGVCDATHNCICLGMEQEKMPMLSGVSRVHNLRI